MPSGVDKNRMESILLRVTHIQHSRQKISYVPRDTQEHADADAEGRRGTQRDADKPQTNSCLNGVSQSFKLTSIVCSSTHSVPQCSFALVSSYLHGAGGSLGFTLDTFSPIQDLPLVPLRLQEQARSRHSLSAQISSYLQCRRQSWVYPSYLVPKSVSKLTLHLLLVPLCLCSKGKHVPDADSVLSILNVHCRNGSKLFPLLSAGMVVLGSPQLPCFQALRFIGGVFVLFTDTE